MRLLKGSPVARAIIERNREACEGLKKQGIAPALAVFRIGEDDADLSYERGIVKRAEECGILLEKHVFPKDVLEEDFYKELEEVNQDDRIHGILVFRPLPKTFQKDELRKRIAPEKDVDGCTDLSLSGVFTKRDTGFAPCTAEAVIETLDYYDIPIRGKNTVVLGRSLVIGKPVSIMLLNRDATVTICHTKTQDTAAIASKADILVCATGEMEIVDHHYVNEHQTVIDVGISWNEKKQKLCGDVLFEDVEGLVENITPVPGGIGSLTTAILLSHVIKAAERTL